MPKPTFFRRVLRFLPMPIFAVLAGLLAGSVAWIILDFFQTKAVRSIVEDELSSQVDLQARESLLRFDNYIQAYTALGKLLANHRNLANYLEPIYWQEDDAMVVKSTKTSPDWLPNTPQWINLTSPSHILLVDSRGRLRELYQVYDLNLPLDLRLNGAQLFPRLQETTYITMFNNQPFLLVSEPAEDTGYNIMGTLILLVPINEIFLQKSQVSKEANLIALLDNDGEKVLISSNFKQLKKGAFLSSAKDRYVMRSQSFIEYGGSDLNLLFATLLPKAGLQNTINRMIDLERKQRIYGVLFIIFIFTLLFTLVSIRLSKTLRRISRFSQLALGTKKPQPKKGNQLLLLDDWIKEFIIQIKQTRDDIDERYAIEIQNKELLRSTIMAVSPDAIITIDAQYRIIDSNPTTELLFGYQQQHIIGRDVVTLLFSGCRTVFIDLLKRNEENQDILPAFELQAQQASQKALPVELSIKSLFLNKQIFYTLYIRDISLRKKQEQEIRSMAAFASESPIPVMRMNQQGNLIYANHASQPILTHWKIAPMDKIPPHWFQLAINALKEKRLIEAELDLGDYIFSLVMAPIEDFGYVNIFARDITEARQAQAQVQQNQTELVHVSRLSTMGEMAAGMAHELNQPLAVIANYANGSLRRIGDKPNELIHPLEQIAAQAQRAGDIIKGLRALVGKQEPVRKIVDLNDLLNEVVLFLELSLKTEQIDLQIVALKSLYIQVDPVQIEQIMLNLLRNAMDAVQQVKNPVIQIKTEETAQYAIFIIQDNGKGMNHATQKQLFHPFFTTRKQGMGMGLAITKTILADHDGEISVTSAINKGTLFKVYLPKVENNE